MDQWLLLLHVSFVGPYIRNVLQGLPDECLVVSIG